MIPKKFVVLCFTASGLALPAGAFSAEPASTVVICSATGPAMAGCAAVGLGIHELVKVANGKDAVGPNGEGMKAGKAVVTAVGDTIGLAGNIIGGGARVKDGMLPPDKHDRMSK